MCNPYVGRKLAPLWILEWGGIEKEKQFAAVVGSSQWPCLTSDRIGHLQLFFRRRNGCFSGSVGWEFFKCGKTSLKCTTINYHLVHSQCGMTFTTL